MFEAMGTGAMFEREEEEKRRQFRINTAKWTCIGDWEVIVKREGKPRGRVNNNSINTYTYMYIHPHIHGESCS